MWSPAHPTHDFRTFEKSCLHFLTEENYPLRGEIEEVMFSDPEGI